MPLTAFTLRSLCLCAASVMASCNPMTSSSTCPSIAAMPDSMTYDLTLNNPDLTYEMANAINQTSTGLDFTLSAQGQAPTIITNDYLLFGNVKAEIKIAPGQGLVTAFVLMSDVLDEIDYEWLGAENSQVQTNYFFQGETANYDRGGTSSVSDPEGTLHTYEIDWTNSTLTWLVDGTAIRTLARSDTASYGYPSTPSQIKIGIWASGDPNNAQGTISWGGGLTDYSKSYTMSLQSLVVQSYTSAKSFSYSGKSGLQASVLVSGQGSSSSGSTSQSVIQSSSKTSTFSSSTPVSTSSSTSSKVASTGTTLVAAVLPSTSATTIRSNAATAAATSTKSGSSTGASIQNSTQSVSSADLTTSSSGSAVIPASVLLALVLSATISL